jgi:hypothetical protein
MAFVLIKHWIFVGVAPNQTNKNPNPMRLFFNAIINESYIQFIHQKTQFYFFHFFGKKISTPPSTKIFFSGKSRESKKMLDHKRNKYN